MNRESDAANSNASPARRGIGRLWRRFFKATPKQSLGHVASIDARGSSPPLLHHSGLRLLAKTLLHPGQILK
jgi:hypothetical protein